MYRTDNATSVAVRPAPAAVGPNPNGFFTIGNPVGPVPATIVDADWMNMVQEEIASVVSAVGIALSKTNIGQLLQAILLLNSAKSGFANRFRNGTLDIWQRGTSGSVGAGSTLYTADGWLIGTAGGSGITWAQAAGLTYTKWSLQITGTAGLTDTFWKQRIESSVAAVLQGQQVTVQAKIFNNSGASITPTLTINHPTVSDNYGAVVADVNGVALQACPNGASTIVAYTFTAAANSILGLEAIFDIGNSLAGVGKSVQVSELEIRATPGLATGLNNSPPQPELRPISFEYLFCQRYLPAIVPGINSALSIVAMQTATAGDALVVYPVLARSQPTGLIVSSPAHFSLTLSGANKTCTSIVFNNAGIYGANVSVVDTNDTWGLNSASQLNSANAAASLIFTGCEL